ncbi:hypothetical protein HZB02_02780 [Candidatus Woesearchaeota archaeon]|nr:hypothetical protein [Candidatus Woesearchaeota archaeon]
MVELLRSENPEEYLLRLGCGTAAGTSEGQSRFTITEYPSHQRMSMLPRFLENLLGYAGMCMPPLMKSDRCTLRDFLNRIDNHTHAATLEITSVLVSPVAENLAEQPFQVYGSSIAERGDSILDYPINTIPAWSSDSNLSNEPEIILTRSYKGILAKTTACKDQLATDLSTPISRLPFPERLRLDLESMVDVHVYEASLGKRMKRFEEVMLQFDRTCIDGVQHRYTVQMDIEKYYHFTYFSNRLPWKQKLE